MPNKEQGASFFFLVTALKYLLSISDLSDSQLKDIVGKTLSAPPKARALDPKKKAIGLIFLEPSTRTRISFERAAQITGRQTIFMEAKGSSVEKGESLTDTLKNLHALNVGTFVIRTPWTGSLNECRDLSLGSIVNAGDGTGEHPTQALLDLCTIVKYAGGGRIEKLKGLKLGIMGDLRRSRVARSWGLLAPRIGIDLTIISPEAWKPLDWQKTPTWTDSKTKVLRDLDVVMALRIQKERMNTLDPNESADFVRSFQITPEELGKKQLLMHPGPVNWGTELSSGFIEDPRSLILRQVEMGLSLRSVVLEALDV